MLKKFARRIGLNFRETRSERSANNAYSNYHNRIKRTFQKISIFNKKTKNI